jgi:hypothetical protein
MYVPIIVTGETITVMLDGKTYSVKKGDPDFVAAQAAVDAQDWEELEHLVSKARTIDKWSQGHFVVTDNLVTYKGERLPEELLDRIIETARRGEDPTNLMNFWERLQANPSFRAVQSLYRFLAHENIPIDKDGFILAYKSVRSDYMDWYSGTWNNSPGTVNEMPRNRISDDPQVACDEGFHVGSLAYVQNFHWSDGIIIICRLDPADVVSVPYDSSSGKIRVCKYEVLGHYGAPLPSTNIEGRDIPAATPVTVEVDDDKDQADSPHEMTLDQVRALAEDMEVKHSLKTPNAEFAEMDRMSRDQLLACNRNLLRAYATHHVKIVGASKVVKEDLIDRILKLRRRA